MKTISLFVTGILAMLVATGAVAQTKVYETRDAEGNVSFSDESSPDSETVEIQRTSVVDAPQPEPQQPVEQDTSGQGDAAREREVSSPETTYREDEDYLYDDPRARREAVRHQEDEPIQGVDPDTRETDRRDVARDGTEGEEEIGTADRAAERSDITGPDAEYRNTERPQQHEGGRR